MIRKGKNQKLAMCKGCNRWVKDIRIHLETGKVEVSQEYCASEDMISASCAPWYIKKE